MLSDGYVLSGKATGDEGYVYDLDLSGQVRWQHSYPLDRNTGDRWDVGVAGTVVITARTNTARADWPGSLIVQALDTTTGNVLWTDDQPSFVSTFATAVYTSVCHGGQNNRVGDCRLSARDPRTGATTWTVPTYASSVVDAPGAADLAPSSLTAPAVPPYLQVASYPTGYDTQTVSTVDPRSGRSLGTSIPTKGGAISTIQAPDQLIAVDDDSNRSDNGCKATVTAYDPDKGKVLWQKAFTGAPDPAQPKYCMTIDLHLTGGRLAVYDAGGRASLVDPATGSVVWTADDPGKVIGGGSGYVITATRASGSPKAEPSGSTPAQSTQWSAVVYHDLSDGKPHDTVRWRIAAATAGPAGEYSADPPLAQVQGSHVVLYDPPGGQSLCPSGSCGSISVLDAATGSLRQAPPGDFVAAATAGGKDLVITADDAGETSTYQGYLLQ